MRGRARHQAPRGKGTRWRVRHREEGVRWRARHREGGCKREGCVENVQIEGEKKSVEKKKEGESEKTYTI